MSDQPRSTRRDALAKFSVAPVGALTAVDAVSDQPVTGTNGAVSTDGDGVSANSTMPPDGEPSDKQSLTYIDTEDQHYKVEAGTPKKVVCGTDHFLTLYRATEERSSEGYYVYIAWHWSVTETNGDWWHDEGELDQIKSWLELKDEEDKLTSMAPTSATDRNGAYVRVSLGVEVGNYGGSTGGDVYVKDGTVAPQAGAIDLGAAGEMGAKYDADGGNQGTVTLHSAAVIRTAKSLSTWDDIGYHWRTKTWASTS